MQGFDLERPITTRPLDFGSVCLRRHGWNSECLRDAEYDGRGGSRASPASQSRRRQGKKRPPAQKCQDGRWCPANHADGLIEGIDSLVKAAQAKARGYRASRTLQAIADRIAGKLGPRLPT